jgi:hypothetical protein
MTWRRKGTMAAVLVSALVLAGWQLAAPAQAPRAPGGRFEFQVVESFDAQYLGDSPGHIGRGGRLVGKPDVALGDPVYEGDHRIGKVTNLKWDRTRESLEIEFDPDPYRLDAAGRPVGGNRITVGLDVWVPLGGGDGDNRK